MVVPGPLRRLMAHTECGSDMEGTREADMKCMWGEGGGVIIATTSASVPVAYGLKLRARTHIIRQVPQNSSCWSHLAALNVCL